MTSPATAADVQSGVEGRVIAQKYRLESLIGEGGMGSIWRAYNLQLEVPVAIKLLRPGLNGSELGERLRVEARAAAKLVHPSIVRVFDIGEAESGEPFIVMELLQGESLGTMLERGPLTAVNALQLMLPIGEALSLAHSRGVVHRDLKPDNIFIANDSACLQPKLLDFGIAKVRTGMLAGGPTLTQTGTLLGSPDYMSPEQACGRSDIDERSDIWAFCVVLYEIIAGRVPFGGDSCQATLQSVIKDDPLPLELVADVDPQLSALIHWGLSKDRDARPGSIFDLGHQLAAWLFARGVLEDATGASLEAKWLGRSNETTSLTATSGLRSPHAQHEHATLMSVVNPSPHPSHDSIDLPNSPRKRRWVPSALVASAALAACVGWASVHQLRLASPTSPGEPRDGLSTPAAAASPQPASAEAITVDALPVEAKAQPSAEPKPYVAVRPPKNASPPTVRAVANTSLHALPQALPTRENPAELLNPY